MKKIDSKPDNLLERVSALLSIPLKPIPIGDAQPRTPPDAMEIESWIIKRLVHRLGTQDQEIDPTVPFANFGMDSQNALGLSGDLEDWLGVELSPTLVWDYPSARQLSCYLAGERVREPSGNPMDEAAGQQG